MKEFKQPFIETEVQPRGNIINDNDCGIDYLGHSIYAEALAEKIDHVSTPITIGIFARWGSGKSFLLKHVRNLLYRKQKQDEIKSTPSLSRCKYWPVRCGVRLMLFLGIASIIIVASLWAVSPHLFVSAEQFQNENLSENVTLTKLELQKLSAAHFWFDFSRFFALAILIACLLFVCIVVCGNNDWWSSKFFANYRLISYVAFTKLPIKSPENSIIKETSFSRVSLKMTTHNQEEEKSNRRYIFVNFNAWEYAGSDTLWAGIVTNLSKAIESEFGSVASRIFRMFEVESIAREVISDDPNATKTALFVNFPNCSEDASVHGAMLEFGVIKSCKRLEACTKRKKNQKHIETKSPYTSWWVVEFSTWDEAHKAHKALYLYGLEALFTDPRVSSETNDHYSFGHAKNESKSSNKTEKDSEKLVKSNFSSSQRIQHDEECKDKSGNVRHNFFYHFTKFPKTTCNFPNLFWWFLIVFAVISLPVITYTLAEALDLDVFRTGRKVPVIVQVVSWLPAIGAASFVMVNFAWAMFHSQRTRINSALQGTKGNMAAQLGFMDKVKTEVKCITKLLQCAEYSHNKKYKVIISVDDLDRVALEKVKSVLEAVSILLSDRSSPFVCLIAVDSRIAVKCIEENMGPALVKNHINGHEYLKKIINLPFCLPEVSNKKKKHYIQGLISLADETKPKRVERMTSGKEEVDAGPSTTLATTNSLEEEPAQTRSSDVIDGLKHEVGDLIGGNIRQPNGRNRNGGTDRFLMQTTNTANGDPHKRKEVDFENGISNKEFIFKCRKFLHKSDLAQRHLEGNPRNIKRIFNVISLTSWILHCYDEQRKNKNFLQRNAIEERVVFNNNLVETRHKACYNDCIKSVEKTLTMAHELVLWVILTDQWPYRMSYLLQVIEDAEQKFHEYLKEEPFENTTSLFDIYRKRVIPELQAIERDDEDCSNLLSLDGNPEILFSFLQELRDSECDITKEKVELLKQITINLDGSLRQTIICQRGVASNLIENEQKREKRFNRDYSHDRDGQGDEEKVEPGHCSHIVPSIEEASAGIVRFAELPPSSKRPASDILQSTI